MIENVTLGQIAVLVAFIVALEKSIEVVLSWFKKPATDVENRLDKRLEKIENDNRMMLKVLYSLLQHDVTNDHVTDMEALYKEMNNYIIGG